jgi:hypothetical protein
MEVRQEEKSRFWRLSEAKKLFQFPEHITMSLRATDGAEHIKGNKKFLIVFVHRPMVGVSIQWGSVKVWKILLWKKNSVEKLKDYIESLRDG